MADAASMIFEIDSSQAAGAAKALDLLDRAASGVASTVAKLETDFKSASGGVMSMAEAARANEGEIKRLAAAYNPALAASLQFSEAQKELARAVELGVISIQQKETLLNTLGTQYVSAGRGAAKFAKGTEVATHHVTNLGAQVGDIGMMMASGQNPFMLMMQQGPQVAQIFSTMSAEGRKIGPTLAAAFSSVFNPMSLLTFAVIGGGAALVQWGMNAYGAEEKALTLEDAVGGLDESFSKMSQYLRVATTDTVELSSKFGDFSSQIKAFNEYAAGIALQESLEASSAVVDALRVNLDAVQTAYDNLSSAKTYYDSLVAQSATDDILRAEQDAIDYLAMQLHEASDAVGLTALQALKLRDALNQVSAGDDLRKQAQAAQEVLKYIEGVYGNARQLPSALRPIYTEMTNIVSKASEADAQFDKFDTTLNYAVTAAKNLAGSVGDIGGAAARSQIAIENMTAAIRTAAGEAVFGPTSGPSMPSGLGNFGLNPLGQGLAPGSSPKPPPRPTLKNDPNWGWDSGAGGGGGGGGGGVEDEMKSRWEALSEGFRAESALTMEQYAKDQEALKWALDQKKITIAEYNDNLAIMQTNAWGVESQQTLLKYTMEQESLQAALDHKLMTQEQYLMRSRELQHQYYSDAIGIDQSGSAQQLSQMSADFAQMNSLAGGGYNSLLQAQKTFAAGAATINAYLAASQALADPTVSFWGKFAAYAKVLAAGMGLVNGIKGSGGGGGASAATSAAGGASANSEPNREVMVKLDGPDWMVDMAEQVLTQVYKQTRDGRVVVSRAGRQ